MFTLFHFGNGAGEGWHHPTRREPAQVTAVFGGGAGGFFRSEFGEISAGIQLGDNGLGLFFGFQQDMAGLVFLHVGAGNLLFIDLLDVFFLHRVFAEGLLDQGLDHQFDALLFQHECDLGILFNLLFFCFLVE